MYLPLLTDISTQVGTSSSIAQLLATELRSPWTRSLGGRRLLEIRPIGNAHDQVVIAPVHFGQVRWWRASRTSSHDTATQPRHQGTGGHLNNLGLPGER